MLEGVARSIHQHAAATAPNRSKGPLLSTSGRTSAAHFDAVPSQKPCIVHRAFPTRRRISSDLARPKGRKSRAIRGVEWLKRSYSYAIHHSRRVKHASGMMRADSGFCDGE